MPGTLRFKNEQEFAKWASRLSGGRGDGVAQADGVQKAPTRTPFWLKSFMVMMFCVVIVPPALFLGFWCVMFLMAIFG